jgi:membrane protein implicated in regulation of membrane protease activity
MAEAVSHVEQGLSGMTAINLGIAFALLGGAIISSGTVASWLGCTAALVGVVQMVSVLIWMVAAAAVLWRQSSHNADAHA